MALKQVSHWSFFPSIENNRLNIKRDKNAVKDVILHYLLVRKGEHPIYPMLGLPDIIFRPVSEISSEAFAEIIRLEILDINNRFGLGIDTVSVFSVQSIVSNSYGSIVSPPPTPNNFILEIYLKFRSTDPLFSLSIDYQTMARVA